MKGAFLVRALSLALALIAAGVPAAAGDVVLKRVSGAVGYTTTPGGPTIALTSSVAIDSSDYALTQTRSMAALLLPDSSVVSIAESSKVRVGQFLVSDGIAHMIVGLMGGALHFSVRHPSGARASYVFRTPTADIAVRGTEGMIAALPGETIVACVHGSADDTLVTSRDGVHVYLPPGRTLVIRTNPKAVMMMTAGVMGPAFQQFAGIVARNHADRMNARK